MSLTASKSKSTASTSSSSVSLQDTDGTTVAGNSASTVNITDGGAVEANRDVSLSVIEKAAELTLGLVTAQAKANESALGFATAAQEQANKFAFDAGRPEASTLQQSGKILLWVGGLIAGAMILKELNLQ